MNTNRLLIVLLILAALLTPEHVLASSGTSPVVAVPVSAGWTGTTSRGHPMLFTVQSSGTQWSSFKLKTDYNASSCGVSGTLEITVPGPGSIATNQFSVSGGSFSAAGQFTSSTTATGTYSFTNHPIVISLPFPPFTCTYFFNQSGTWTASTSGGGGGMLTLESDGTVDGWILESSETSSQGGGMNAITPTFLLGDNAANKQYRSILSFCPAGLPSGANITQAKLKIKRQGLVGTDPFTTHNKIAVDIRQGSFSNNLALQLNDFKATSSLNAVGLISNNPQAGNWYSVNLNSSAFAFIQVTSCVQLRLRFQLDDNNDLSADFLRFYSGDSVAKPKLILTYTLP